MTTRLLTRHEAAEYLNVSVRTLDAWRAQKKIGHFVVGGTAIRFSVEDLDRIARHEPAVASTPQKRRLLDRIRGRTT